MKSNITIEMNTFKGAYYFTEIVALPLNDH